MNCFKQEKERFERFLDQHAVWILATVAQNDISARSMSIIHQESKIYFQTDTCFEKYRHIRENPHVALCCANYQVKGLAKILGHGTAEENAGLMAHYQKVHPDSYRRYSNRKNQRLIEFEPETIQIWDYINHEPYITRVNLVMQTAETLKYE